MEAASMQKMHCASLMWDISAYYEHLNRADLCSRGEALGYPRQIIRLCNSQYATTRYVTLNGNSVHLGWAKTGIVAGCAHATTFIQILCFKHIMELGKVYWWGLLNMYIDDLLLAAWHTSMQILIERVRDMGQAVIYFVE